MDGRTGQVLNVSHNN